MKEPVDLRVCGRVEYDDGLRAMRLHEEALRKGTDSDALLLLEHPHTYTLGRGAKPADILLADEALDRLGVGVYDTDRGGEVTYHGPGQLVAYPLVDLNPDRRDVRKWVRALEETMIRTCAQFGVTAERIDGLPGVWVRGGERGDRKIGAVGVHLSHWISTHGIALNVETDLSMFQHIVPCGIRDKGVTSLAAEGVATTWRDAANAFASHFSEVLGVRLRRVEPELRTVQAALLRDDGKILVIRRTMPRGGFWQTVTGRIERREGTLAAAKREIREETGADVEVIPLDFEHDFPLDPGITRRPLVTVKWCRETCFYARVPASFDCRRNPREHDAHEWLDPADAIKRMPFAGLRRAIRLALEKEGRPVPPGC